MNTMLMMILLATVAVVNCGNCPSFAHSRTIKSGCSWRSSPWFVNRVLKQPTENVCAAVAVTYVLENLFSRKENEVHEFSPQYIIDRYNARQVEGVLQNIDDNEVCIDTSAYRFPFDGRVHANEGRVCTEPAERPLRVTFDQKFWEITTFEELENLITVNPIIAIIHVPTNFRDDNHRVTEYHELAFYEFSETNSYYHTRHAVMLTGFMVIRRQGQSSNEHLFEMKSSWGSEWGDGGYRLVKVEQVEQMELGKLITQVFIDQN